MKLKSEAILFSGKDEENKDPSNTPSIVHLHFSPFDASCFRSHLLDVSCLRSRVSQSVTRADGKGWCTTFWYDSPQPDFLLLSKPIVHVYTNILSTLSRLFRKSDLFQQPISQLSSKLCVFLTWSHHCFFPPQLIPEPLSCNSDFILLIQWKPHINFSQFVWVWASRTLSCPQLDFLSTGPLYLRISIQLSSKKIQVIACCFCFFKTRAFRFVLLI